MIRRNFFKIATGAIAALFVPKVAGAMVEKTIGPIASRNQDLNVRLSDDDIVELVAHMHKEHWEGIAKDMEQYCWDPPGKMNDKPHGLAYWMNHEPTP